MEEEKKKKKNKKKRGKQAKPSEDASIDGEADYPEQNHVADPKQNHHIQVSSNAVVQSVEMSELDVKTDCHQINEVEGVSSTVLLEEEVRQLKAEKLSCLQREKHLEEEMNQVILDQRSWILKEANLKEEITHLQNEIDSLRQKEASLEEIIKQLQNEKDSWTLKEVNFEERIKHLESGKDSWILKENSAKEMITRLNEVNIGLQTQVKELEEFRNGLLRENQQLVESMSHLELRIQHLEREGALSSSSTMETTVHASNEDDPNSLVEAAQALVEKLIVENAELVEKVNELYVELDRRGITAAQSSKVIDPALEIATTSTIPGYLTEYGEKMLIANEAMQFPTSIQNKEETVVEVSNADSRSIVDARMDKDELQGSFKTSESTSDIVEVPLDKNDIQEVEIMENQLEENNVRDIESHAMDASEDAGVALSDAPLIGAPFRLISFFAKYVSGADLVNKNSSDSGI